MPLVSLIDDVRAQKNGIGCLGAASHKHLTSPVELGRPACSRGSATKSSRFLASVCVKVGKTLALEIKTPDWVVVSFTPVGKHVYLVVMYPTEMKGKKKKVPDIT